MKSARISALVLSLLASASFGAEARAQIAFEESMTNWVHIGNAGWTDDFTLTGSKGGKVDRLDSATVLNYTRTVTGLKKGHYVATIRIQKFKSITGAAPFRLEVTNAPGTKETTVPFSHHGVKLANGNYKFLNEWTWLQPITFEVRGDNAPIVFRLSNVDATVTKQDYYFDWFKIGRVPEGKVLKYQSHDYGYAPWSQANQGSGVWYRDHVKETSSAFGEVTEVSGNNWLEHRSFYGWRNNINHPMVLQPGVYTYNFRVFVPNTGKWSFTLQHRLGTDAWVKRDWSIPEQQGGWTHSPNISFEVKAKDTPLRFIFKNTNSGGKRGYKFDAFLVRRGAFDISGKACKSSLGDVLLEGNVPQLGEPFTVSASNVPSIAVFMIGATKLNIDLTSAGMTGCTLYMAPIVTVGAAATNGVATTSGRLPSSSSLLGARFLEQALILDAKANAFGAALSTLGTAVIQN